MSQESVDIGYAALYRAATNGHTTVCEMLLEKGTVAYKERTRWNSMLQPAAANGHTLVCRLLLEKGGTATHRYFDYSVTAALMEAAANGHAACCELLLEKGAAVNQGRTDDGWTALMAAAANGHVSVCELLLEKGADVNQGRTDDGWTALMAAAFSGHACVCELLLEKGADASHTNHRLLCQYPSLVHRFGYRRDIGASFPLESRGRHQAVITAVQAISEFTKASIVQ